MIGSSNTSTPFLSEGELPARARPGYVEPEDEKMIEDAKGLSLYFWFIELSISSGKFGIISHRVIIDTDDRLDADQSITGASRQAGLFGRRGADGAR